MNISKYKIVDTILFRILYCIKILFKNKIDYQIFHELKLYSKISALVEF